MNKVYVAANDNNKMSVMDFFKNMIISGDDETCEQALREKHDSRIRAKLEAGKRLTRQEMQYLQKYNPILYAYALRVETKRHMVEERLKHAKSKREVQDIQDEAIYTIGKNDPARHYMMAAVMEAVKEFKETDEYKRLPETEEKQRNSNVREGNFDINYEYVEGDYQLAYAVNSDSNVHTGFVAVS